MTWSTDLMGFVEESPNQVRSQSTVKHDKLTSLANGKEYQIGEFQLFSLTDIRAQSDSLLQKLDQPVSVTELSGNIQAFHQQAVNRGALLQVA